jgi:radical SAM protein with 4Fe4S-binding SPASM domain
MADDRGLFTKARRIVDRVFGEGITHTVLYRFPELLNARRDHFREVSNLSISRSLFARAVRYIEVETHSYCNRTCWFCPNSYIDRRTQRRYLPESVFCQLLVDLKTVRYARKIGFSRYNEPLGDEVIYERLRQAHDALPRAQLQIYTNGDFLTPDNLDRLSKLGLKDLFIGAYLPDSQSWTSDAAEHLIKRIAKRVQISISNGRESPNTRVTYQARHRAIEISIFCPNYSREGVDRGGSVTGVPISTYVRTSPCLYPITNVYIDYNGSVMPCCHLRSDVPSHKGCALGRIDDSPGSIFSVWSSEIAARWRRMLTNFEPKSGPCQNCAAQTCSNSRLGRRAFQSILEFGKARNMAT